MARCISLPGSCPRTKWELGDRDAFFSPQCWCWCCEIRLCRAAAAGDQSKRCEEHEELLLVIATRKTDTVKYFTAAALARRDSKREWPRAGERIFWIFQNPPSSYRPPVFFKWKWKFLPPPSAAPEKKSKKINQKNGWVITFSSRTFLFFADEYFDSESKNFRM